MVKTRRPVVKYERLKPQVAFISISDINNDNQNC